MYTETERYIEELRNRANAARRELDEAKALFGENDDEYLQSQIRQASFWLDDVETHFIAMLTESRSIPHTLTEESIIASGAEFHMNQVVSPFVKKIHDWAIRYGPNFQSIG
jgi:hypothetical protein